MQGILSQSRHISLWAHRCILSSHHIFAVFHLDTQMETPSCHPSQRLLGSQVDSQMAPHMNLVAFSSIPTLRVFILKQRWRHHHIIIHVDSPPPLKTSCHRFSQVAILLLSPPTYSQGFHLETQMETPSYYIPRGSPPLKTSCHWFSQVAINCWVVTNIKEHGC